MREPSQKATPQSVDRDVQLYQNPAHQTGRIAVKTLFDSVEDFMITADLLAQSVDTATLEQQAQSRLFSRMGARVAIGQSYQREKWEAFAKTEAKRIIGVTPGTVEARYTTPGLDVARFAILRTQAYAAGVPLGILRKIGLTESGYVAGLSLTGKVMNYEFDHTVENGVSDTVHRAVMVDCLEDSERRNGVGRQWLRQASMVLDAVISRSPTTYNDIEFSQLMPQAHDITQDRLDFPDSDDTVVFDIASTKAARFTEILSGGLILPGDDTFYGPEQLQQELLLRRLYGTFPTLPLDYFERFTEFRRTHDNDLPLWGGQLAA
jgi:hypothetical protein